MDLNKALLTPKQAAVIANAVYVLRTRELNPNPKRMQSQTGTDKDWSSHQRFIGTSGTLTTKRTGFGFCALGSGHAFAKHAIIATRGTAMPWFDVLTDLNALTATTKAGNKAHRGFVHVFATIEQGIKNFLNAHDITTIHCIGHSLGGALATLIAERFCDQYETNLYNFGCPRVGFAGLEQRLKDNKVTSFRVYNDADPVAMVPIHPYVHVCNGMRCGSQFFINPGAHSMNNYVKSVETLSWQGLLNSPDPDSIQFNNLDLVERAVTTHPKLLSTKLLKLLKFLIRAAEVALALPLAAVLGAVYTLADCIAFLILKAAEKVRDIARGLKTMVKGIISLIGLKINQGADITRTFLTYVLERFLSVVRLMTSNALAMVAQGAQFTLQHPVLTGILGATFLL